MTLRIAHVIASIADSATGPAQSVPALCNELAALGHHVELHVLDYGGATRRSNERYELFAYPYWRGTGRIGLSPEMHRGLRRAARQVDVMHWHGLWMMPNLYPAWAAANTPCTLVVSPRGTLEVAAMNRSPRIKALVWSALQGPAFRAASLVHVTSEMEARSVRAARLEQPIVVVQNGIHLPVERLIEVARATRKERRRALYLGRIHPIKGLDRLIRAWKHAERTLSDWDLEIVGPDYGNHLAELQALTRAIGAERVQFAGPLFGEARDRKLASADVYMLASHSENFAMSVAEALAAGTPVICSRGAPWSELEKRNCGFWVENSERGIGEALKRASRISREEFTAMGDRGRDWMRQEYDWAAKARAWADAYIHTRAGAHGTYSPAVQALGAP
jgi:glycosyltransferase involved in cell wall biosynthesis